MKCPIDGAELIVSDRLGIEIDHCPRCRGVWLDRGELDKIIERALPPDPPQPPEPARFDDSHPDPRYEGRDFSDSDYRQKPRKTRESFLRDLFDV